ncbi:MAG: extracellular solute-binding protein [Nitrospirota bacterium]|nr:extracellular solute-binding protein [Nitrospirota bacterium]
MKSRPSPRHDRPCLQPGLRRPLVLLSLCLSLVLGGFPGLVREGAAADKLIVYSGRAEKLIKPVLDAFQAKTGVQVELLSSGTTELVNRLQAEGGRTPADVLITNDAGSLERARELGLLQPLHLKEIDQAIAPSFRAADGSWIGLSGRFWTLVYNTNLVKPGEVQSVLDLAEPRWKGKIAIPNAGSEYLQAGVSVIKVAQGDERTQKLLLGLKSNAGTFVYGKSSQIVDALAKGEVAMGLVNHYYLYRYLADHPGAPIAIHMLDQQDNGMGAIMNIAGAGVVKHSRHLDSAKRLMEFLVSRDGQKLFADLNKEYPLHPEVPADPALPKRETIRTAAVPLARLAELREPAMAMIEQAGLR